MLLELKDKIDARRRRHLNNGQIAVDLDGTLAYHTSWVALDVIVDPILPMVERVKVFIAQGYDVVIFTARLSDDPDGIADRAIREWTKKHIGKELDVTCIKRKEFVEFWDDRGIQVIPNTGKTVLDEALLSL